MASPKKTVSIQLAVNFKRVFVKVGWNGGSKLTRLDHADEC